MTSRICGREDPLATSDLDAAAKRCHRPSGHPGTCSFAAPAATPAPVDHAAGLRALAEIYERDVVVKPCPQRGCELFNGHGGTCQPFALTSPGEASAYEAYRGATAKLHATELQHEADKKAWQVALAALNRTLVEG